MLGEILHDITIRTQSERLETISQGKIVEQRLEYADAERATRPNSVGGQKETVLPTQARGIVTCR
jgi:hypothetical protein